MSKINRVSIRQQASMPHGSHPEALLPIYDPFTEEVSISLFEQKAGLIRFTIVIDRDTQDEIKADALISEEDLLIALGRLHMMRQWNEDAAAGIINPPSHQELEELSRQ